MKLRELPADTPVNQVKLRGEHEEGYLHGDWKKGIILCVGPRGEEYPLSELDPLVSEVLEYTVLGFSSEELMQRVKEAYYKENETPKEKTRPEDPGIP